MTHEKYFIDCRISPGTFNDEFYVILTDNGSSALVNRKNVHFDAAPEKGAEVDGQVQAYLIDDPEGRDVALIELPGEPVVGGLRTWVPKSLLARQETHLKSFPTNSL